MRLRCHRQAARAAALRERLQRRKPGRRLDAVVPLIGGTVLTEDAYELIDLAGRLACDRLDRLERRARTLRIPLLQKPRGPRLDEDHVECVAGGVVQITGDPAPLLGRGEAALTFGLALGGGRAALELGAALAPIARPLADHPRGDPDESGQWRRHLRVALDVHDAPRDDLQDEERRDDGLHQPWPTALLLLRCSEEVERDDGAWRLIDISERDERGIRRGGGREYRQRGAAARSQRERGQSREYDGEPVELPVAAGLARGERERQHDDRDTGVEQDGSSDCTSIAMQRGLRGHWKSDRTAGWTGARLPRGGSERPPWAVARSALEQERRPLAAVA